MKNKQTLAFTILFLIAIGLISVTPAYAQVTDDKDQVYQVAKEQVKQNLKELKSELKAAILNHDYAKWSDLMSKIQEITGKTPRILEKINSAEKFEKFAQMHNSIREGKLSDAKALRSELGLPSIRETVRRVRNK